MKRKTRYFMISTFLLLLLTMILSGCNAKSESYYSYEPADPDSSVTIQVDKEEY